MCSCFFFELSRFRDVNHCKSITGKASGTLDSSGHPEGSTYLLYNDVLETGAQRVPVT